MKRELISNGNPLEDKIGFSRAVKVGPYISIGGTAPVGEDGKNHWNRRSGSPNPPMFGNN